MKTLKVSSSNSFGRLNKNLNKIAHGFTMSKINHLEFTFYLANFEHDKLVSCAKTLFWNEKSKSAFKRPNDQPIKNCLIFYVFINRDHLFDRVLDVIG